MTNFYSVEGARLAFRDSATGLPVVFLHPTPLDGDYWRPMIGYLAGVRAIVPDFRAHGASELGAGLPVGLFAHVPDAPVLTMHRLAQDVLALLDHLKIDTAVFAGCSIGGYVLLELWRLAPQRMRGFVFVCSKPQPDAPANHEKRAATIAKARAGALDTVFDGNAQTLIGATARASRPAIISELRSHMTFSADALVAVQAGLAVRPDSVPTVATITAPILAVAGGEDPGITPAEMEVFRQAKGPVDFHTLPNAGHFAAYEQPETIAKIMTPWLRQFHI